MVNCFIPEACLPESATRLGAIENSQKIIGGKHAIIADNVTATKRVQRQYVSDEKKHVAAWNMDKENKQPHDATQDENLDLSPSTQQQHEETGQNNNSSKDSKVDNNKFDVSY